MMFHLRIFSFVKEQEAGRSHAGDFYDKVEFTIPPGSKSLTLWLHVYPRTVYSTTVTFDYSF